MLRLVCFFALLATVLASSHFEAPSTAGKPAADISDFYMFNSYETGREDFVTFLINTYPIAVPSAGPNYASLSTNHFYILNIDEDGDALPDKTFEFLFEDQLGGDAGTFEEVDEDPCTGGNITDYNGNGGIELMIGTESVAVPLKFVGPITAASNAALNWFETYSVTLNGADVTEQGNGNTEFVKPFDYAGEKTFPDYESYAEQYIYDVTFPGCGDGKMFVGPRKESFPISLGRVFDLINMNPIPGDATSINDCQANDELSGLNVITLALEVPKSCFNPGADGVIGAWATVNKLEHEGANHVVGTQVSRLGTPLVNELAIGLRDKGLFNHLPPHLDALRFATYVTHPTLPAIINLLFNDPSAPTLAPTVPRNDLVAVFLTGVAGLNMPENVTASEMMRLNIDLDAEPADTQSPFGVIGGDLAGFPNGRRPGDDVVDIALRVMMGVLCTGSFEGTWCDSTDAPVGTVEFTDGAPNSAMFFQEEFPYLNTPNPGARNNTDFCAADTDGSNDGDSDSDDECAASAHFNFLKYFY